MGTNEQVVSLQLQIKKLLAELGWSQNQLARIIYTETHDFDDESQIISFQERLKKELRRETTKPEKLKGYLTTIVNHPDAERIDIVTNKYVATEVISSSLSDGMGEISKEIDSYLQKNGFDQ